MKQRFAFAGVVCLLLATVAVVGLRGQGPRAGITASSVQATNTTGPDFIANATSGPPLQVSSNTLVSNLNADLLDGFHSTAFAQLTSSNTFTGNQTVNGTMTANSFSGDGSGLTVNIPTARSYLKENFAVPPNAGFQPIYFDQINDPGHGAYSTLGASVIQTGPWRCVAPTPGRYRISAVVDYIPNGAINVGQYVRVEIFVNGGDYGAIGAFYATTSTSPSLTDIYIQGEEEVLANAGDSITVDISQNTGQTGYITGAGHVLVARLGN